MGWPALPRWRCSPLSPGAWAACVPAAPAAASRSDWPDSGSSPPKRRRGGRAVPTTPTERFLAHTLAVGQLYVELVESGVEVFAYDAEPECWRPYLAAYGGRAVCKPDAYVKLGVGEYEHSWLLERDMATEALGTVERQARRHLDYYRSGVERRTRGVTPRVAWIVPDARRAEAVQTALDRLPTDAKKLFAVATAAEAVTLLTAEARR